MDLNSTKDMLLLRNCIILQIKILNLNLEKSNSSNFSQIKNTIDIYTRLLNHLNIGDFENATNIIKSSSTTDVFSDFSKYISSTPPKKVASEILD